jgi:hypothetical protein
MTRRLRTASSLDALGDFPPHELGLHAIHAGPRRPHSQSSAAAPRDAVSPWRPIRNRAGRVSAAARVVVRPIAALGSCCSRLGGVAALEAVLAGSGGSPGSGNPSAWQVVVDLAVAGRVPAAVIRDARVLLPAFVIAQQVADLVNQQRRVFFDAVRRHPPAL